VHWLYEAHTGSLRERMKTAAEIFLLPVAAGEIREEPFPDLFPRTELFPDAERAPSVTPLVRAPRRRSR
jgi:hypothetical protein